MLSNLPTTTNNPSFTPSEDTWSLFPQQQPPPPPPPSSAFNSRPITPTPLHPTPSRNPSISTTSHLLETALHKTVHAVALLHRCGSTFKTQSEAFWIFCAGSWTRERYEREVGEMMKKLKGGGGRSSTVEEDLRSARRILGEAVAGLRKGEVRDWRDLERCVEGCGVWGRVGRKGGRVN